jgi:hypothetical protein
MSCKCIGECPSNSPFLKTNGAEAPRGPMPIVFKEWRDTRTFSNLKSTHCTLLIINLVTKKVCVHIPESFLLQNGVGIASLMPSYEKCAS